MECTSSRFFFCASHLTKFYCRIFCSVWLAALVYGVSRYFLPIPRRVSARNAACEDHAELID